MIADQFDLFLLDLDGVLYLEDTPIDASVQAVRELVARGKAVRILTNNPRLPRAMLANRLYRDGVSIDEADIVTSGWAAARFLKQAGTQRADVVGSAGAIAALESESIAVTEENPDAVIVAADRSTTYLDLQRAMRHIEHGAQFVGTNPDTSYPTPSGRALGAGALIQALEAATGVHATIVGKPEPLMFEMALGEIDPDVRVVMIGDNPDTDIRGAHRAGLPSILIAPDDESRSNSEANATLTTLTALFDDAISLST